MHKKFAEFGSSGAFQSCCLYAILKWYLHEVLQGKGEKAMPGDLHTHSMFSDGSCKAEMLPRLAKAAGLGTLAITDHDSMAGLRFGYAHLQMDGVRLLPGMELSGYDFARGRKVHILCYLPRDCEELGAHCALMAKRRHDAVWQSMQLLEQRCPQFRHEDALLYAKYSEGALFKAYVMRAMMEYGLADGVYGSVYKQLFRPVSEGGISFKFTYPDCRDLLRLGRQCGGVVVLAHPTVYKSMELAHELASEGLLDGVELDHPRNTPEDRAELARIAQEHDLIVTGGTDFHGMNRKILQPIGTGQTSDAMIERIFALAQSRK